MRLIVLAACLVLGLRAPVADACTCARPSLATAAARAGVAFVGTITTQHDDPRCDPKHPTWCSHAWSYEVRVEGVWKGALPRTVTVRAGSGHGDCSRGSLGRRVVGQRWLFFAARGREVSIRTCGGTRRATSSAIAWLSRRYGRPAAP